MLRIFAPNVQGSADAPGINANVFLPSADRIIIRGGTRTSPLLAAVMAFAINSTHSFIGNSCRTCAALITFITSPLAQSRIGVYRAERRAGEAVVIDFE